MSCIAIITARGGSKRIPRKNVRDFCGKPIIVYSIEAALQSGIFDVVMVSTDDEEIAELSRNIGAEVPFMRSSDNANDFATTDDVLIEVLSEYEKIGRVFSEMCCLYPTAPFVTAEKLQNAHRILIENNAKEVMPVVGFSFPPQRAVVGSDSGRLEYVYPEKYECRSQDLKKWYHDAGQFYFYNVSEFLRKKGRILDDIFPVIFNDMEVQDIDNEEDWKLAELKYRILRESQR